MKTPKNLIVLMVSFSIFVCICFAQEPYVYGNVNRIYTDGTEVVASGCQIYLLRVEENEEYRSEITYTDPYGKYAIYNLPGRGDFGQYTIVINSSPEVTDSADINITRNFTKIDIRLNSEGEIIEITPG